MARAPKVDALLSAETDLARMTLSATVEPGWVGEYLGVAADDDRVLTHRFEARLPGYAGWNWYVTLARVPRGKVATVCETGLLPGEGAIVAPAWVPWADRVRPEELQAQREAEAAEAAGQESGGKEPEQKPEQSDGAAASAATGTGKGSAAEPAQAPADEQHEGGGEDDPAAEQTQQPAGRGPQRSRSRRRRR
ncbi:MAG: DUF3027 domain-containing protein [Micrococcaceae bacterium]|nr:DUF3027 domain-containing protein [Micrococcaceae bacterium]